MTQFKRARIAITGNVTTPNPATDIYSIAYNSETLHIGHARSVLLASLIAEELGTPFHIRLDGRPLADVGNGVLARWDRGNGILDMVNLANFLGVEYERMYWTPSGIQSYKDLGFKIGEDKAEELRKVLMASNYGPDHHHIPTFLDDFVDNAPSLIIRGMEFRPEFAAYFGVTSLTGATYYTAMEDIICGVLGVEKHEINVPLVLLGETKMSKSLMAMVHWSSMVPFGSELARDFLVATAMSPDDPFSALGEKFSVDKMSEKPYRWDWNDWKALARMS